MNLNQYLIGLDSLLLTIHPWLGGSSWFLLLLLGVGAFYTVLLGFPQVRSLKEGFQTFFGKGSGTKGDIKPRGALFSALSGTVGTGNIGGVAVAIAVGGPAALLWMWVTAALGMATKLAEISLSHKYRTELPDGTMEGGPMNVIHQRLGLKWLAVIFAVMAAITALGTGNSIQMSTLATTLDFNVGIPPLATAAVLGLIATVTILGGVRSIARVAEYLVPFMQLLYVLGCLVVILANFGNIPSSVGQIFSSAFTGTAITGGFLGAGVAYAMQVGVARGLFSNEAGQGSSPIIHAASKEENSMREGTMAMLEPLIDTLIICTLTGLAILSSGVWSQKYHNQFEISTVYYVEGAMSEQDPHQASQLKKLLHGAPHELRLFNGEIEIMEGKAISHMHISLLAHRSIAEGVSYSRQGQPHTGTVQVKDGRLQTTGLQLTGKSLLSSTLLTSKAFASSPLGSLGPYIVTLCLTLFAFSTVLVWSYYGDRACAWLWGIRAVLPYRLIFLAVFVLSAFVDATVFWHMADVSNALMALPNLLALIFLSFEVRKMYRRHRKGK